MRHFHRGHYRLLAFSGLRGCEARRLTWADIDLAGGVSSSPSTPRRVPGFQATHRVLPIPPPLKAALKARKKERKPAAEDFVLDHASVDARPNNWPRDMARDCKKAGLPHPWPPMLRHSSISWLAQSGRVTLPEIRELAGHESIVMTMRYAHLIPQANQAAGAALANYVSDKTTEKTTEKRGRKKKSPAA